MYKVELQRAQELWTELSREWGLGPGYRDRVAGRQDAWFSEIDPATVEQDILGVLNREWQTVCERVSAIFDAE